jgi:hypothetical protein
MMCPPMAPIGSASEHWIKHGRLHLVEVDQKRRTVKASQPVFQAAQECLSVLSGNRLAVALARITQYQAQHPTAARLSLTVIDRCSQAEIQLKLLTRLAFPAPDTLGLCRSELAHKSFCRLVKIRKTVFLYQILVNTLRAESDLRLGR